MGIKKKKKKKKKNKDTEEPAGQAVALEEWIAGCWVWSLTTTMWCSGASPFLHGQILR
jgi:hypothetical protein